MRVTVTYVAGGLLGEHLVKLAPIGPPVTFLRWMFPATAIGGAKLPKLAVEGLPVGRGAAQPTAVFVYEFRPYVTVNATR